MNKKIIVLNGSPRKNGNTSGLIDAFTAGGVNEIGDIIGKPVLDEARRLGASI